MDCVLIRGGVPVLSLWMLKPFSLKKFSNSIEAWSPLLPAENVFSPMCTTPSRKVPTVKITVGASIVSPVSSITPVTSSASNFILFTVDCKTVRSSWFIISC